MSSHTPAIKCASGGHSAGLLRAVLWPCAGKDSEVAPGLQSGCPGQLMTLTKHCQGEVRPGLHACQTTGILHMKRPESKGPTPWARAPPCTPLWPDSRQLQGEGKPGRGHSPGRAVRRRLQASRRCRSRSRLWGCRLPRWHRRSSRYSSCPTSRWDTAGCSPGLATLRGGKGSVSSPSGPRTAFCLLPHLGTLPLKWPFLCPPGQNTHSTWSLL